MGGWQEVRRINLAGVLILAVLALCVGLMVFGVMRRQLETQLGQGLQLSLKIRVQHLADVVESEIAKTTTIATRPYLIGQLRRFNRNPDEPGVQGSFERAARTFLPQGFSAIAFRDINGRQIASEGRFSSDAEVQLELSSSPSAYLLRDRIAYLHVDSPIEDQGKRIGDVVTEAPVGAIDQMLADIGQFGQSADLALCAPLEQDMTCFHTTLSPEAFPRISRRHAGEPLPMSHALDGNTGVIKARDYRDAEVVAAYSPVDNLGLGMVMKIDSSELYLPVWARLPTIAALLLVLLLGGIALLRWQVTPLVRRMARSERDARESHRRLADSDAHLRVLTEVSPVGIFRTDANGHCIFVNERYCEITGLGHEEALGEGWAGAIYPEDAERVFAAWNDAVRARRPFSIECRYRQPDGALIWILAQATVETDADGQVRGYVGSITDITERRCAEEALQASEERYRNIVETAQEGIWQVDADNRTVFVNRKMADILGYSVDEMAGRPMFDFMDESGREIAKHNIERRRQGVTEVYEFRFLAKDGRTVWALVNASPVFNEEGAYTGAFAMVADITARKRVEAALSQSEQNFRALIEDANIGVLVHYAGKHVFGNARLLEMLGYTQAEFYGTGMEDIVHPDEYPKVLARFEARRAGEKVPNVYETILRARDGRSVPVELTSTQTHWEGKGAGLVFLQDISEREHAVEEMHKLSSAVEQTADAVMITSPEGVIEYVNSAFESTTGYTRDEVIGQKPSFLKSDRHEAEFYRRLWETILAGQVYSDVFVNRRKDGSIYYEEKTITPLKDSSGRITNFVSTGKDVTERTQIQERLQYLAQHDVLTQLPNRMLLFDQLKRALVRARRHNRLVGVLFIDLDRFKNINDSLGHEAGDHLLQQLSERLRVCVRDDDTVARFGGDEFVILLDDVAQQSDVGDMAQKVLDELVQPFNIDGRQFYITASIGVSLFPSDGDDSSTLLKHADVAMYRAKDLGKNVYQFYSADMSARAFERLTLETSLRHALERNEFVLHYQPQVEVATGRIIGLEALLRWQHPEFGMVAPAEFMSLLEETGLIVPVGEWVLQEAATQLRTLSKPNGSPLRMAVNLSARQFNSPILANAVERALEKLDGSGATLELEITESLLMQNAATTLETLSRLAAMKCRFAIDDFGTGYSSLAYLKRFPISVLKIDRSFVRDIQDDKDDAAIVSTIIAMAHNLKLEVVAEGVESEAQRAYLERCGCDAMQGYLISRPVPPQDLPRMLGGEAESA